MASVDDRWFATNTDGERVKTSRHGKGKRWLLRWRDPDGTSHKMSFDRKTDADAKRVAVEGDMQRGTYLDPKAGRQTFDEFAAEWLAQRTSDPLTIQNTAHRLKKHVTGTPLGRSPIGKVRPSTVQAWLKNVTLSASSTRVLFDNVASIFAAAVDDAVIGRNPCASNSVVPPKRTRGQIVPWTHERVGAVRASIAARYRPLVVLGAGIGLRPGESFGLSPGDIDWLRGWVTIRRQVKLVGHRRVFAPPKGGKERVVPLPASVKDELAAYLAKYPPIAATLPWRVPDGESVTVPLILRNDAGRALNSKTVSQAVWHPALKAAGVPVDRSNGLHALRHYYASVLLDEGESVKALAEYLGHADAGFTLRTYTHLMPSSETRTRNAIDKAFSLSSCAPDVPQASL